MGVVFSPYPYAIAGFFFSQQLFQLAWLWKLWKQEGTSADRMAQLGYIATALEPLNRRSTPNFFSYIVAKTFAGIGVLDLLHNTSAAYYRDVPPSGLVQIATGVGFAAAASVSDWIFGGCLVYDLAELAVGQAGTSWGNRLGGYGAMTAGIVGFKNYFRMSSSAYRDL
ncbi:hypothetical protein BU25DRAFT_443568 [Macroventuria anomochaeta]|uniref:Uncharacterized protein n=1 Tax=Macroventuria anomochaeta TaxID=301207 RepID=A0ACB6RJ20_9PLEO|nr:uncharacterized protein BU25DRAFT_443568 [Macroventuria anomochaeta]KAF2621769.1 hypothetical protein BU25DRAFT_443568 [Macroventuria anomochaeta]